MTTLPISRRPAVPAIVCRIPIKTRPEADGRVGVQMEAHFHDPHTGRDVILLLDGDWMGYGGNITVGEGGPVIAQMQREFRGRDWLGGQTVCGH